LADGYKRIGDIQGGPYTANVGDTPLALRSYERALSIRQALLASNPGEVADVIGFAEASRLMADGLKSSGNASAALDHAQRAVRALEEVRPSHPGDKQLLQELMRAYGGEASLHASFLVNTSLGDLAAALPLRRKQLEIAEQLYGAVPSDEEGMRTLASALSAMGDQLLMMGERREATQHFVRAQQHLLKLADLSTSRTALFALHDSYYRLLPVHLADGATELALADAQRAIAIARQLVAADAANAQARLVLAADLANFGEVLSQMGRPEEARAAVADAMRIDAELVRQYPNTSQFRTIRQQRFIIGGDISSRAGRHAQALRYYSDARDILQGMIAADPRNQGARLRLAFAQKGIGFSLLHLNELDDASQAFQESVTLLSNEVASGSPGEDAIYAVADAYAGLGVLESARARAAGTPVERVSHLREALARTDRSLQLWQRIKEPGLVSPDGYPCTPVEQVRKQRAQISAALARVDIAEGRGGR
jgi:tetratricopeptide (TPR) repeat protein